MKAVVKLASGPDQIRHLDWDKPVPGPGQALLKVLAVGVCGSDVHILHGRFGGDPPFILGHEFLGQIAEPGPGASCWRKGQRVVAENISGACGICMLCRTGRGYLCPEKRAYGSRSHGAMAEWTVMPAQALHAVPDSIADEDAALTEPLAIACHAALTRGGVGFGEKVLVIGPGPIGLLAVRVAALSGAHLAILGAAEDASRLEMGRSMGAELVLSAADPQWRSRLERWRPGQPIDCVIELSGSAAGIVESIELVGRGRRVVAVGIAGKAVPVPWDEAVVKGIDVRFCFSSAFRDWETALDMMAQGKINPSILVTHRFRLEQWRQALELIEKREAIKCLLLP